jgi:hypothetical protein
MSNLALVDDKTKPKKVEAKKWYQD